MAVDAILAGSPDVFPLLREAAGHMPGTAAALACAAQSSNAWLFLGSSLAIGLGSVAAQVLVPFAAHLSREETRGHTVGKVVSGLLLGIMLARPAASLVADHGGWHTVFGAAAIIVMAAAT